MNSPTVIQGIAQPTVTKLWAGERSVPRNGGLGLETLEVSYSQLRGAESEAGPAEVDAVATVLLLCAFFLLL